MCGIAFLYDPTLSSEERQARIQRTLDAMHHRGPDDSGVIDVGRGIIGHRRLSILDIAGSRQPMVSPDKRYVLSFNGEIYNFEELRGQLGASWNFQTRGDTEILLAGLISHGPAFAEKLDGMWAFAFWDCEAGNLVLSRDRMGEKPLYYCPIATRGIACASELPALGQLTNSGWEEDEDSVADYFRYGYLLPGTTLYRGVREVLPGHIVTWRPGGTPVQHSYWKLREASFEGIRAEAASDLRNAVVNSVKRRLVADVDVGAFLSGGVDSSLITGIVRRELNTTLKTFTVGFSEQAFDERAYARIVADAFATEHYEEVIANHTPDDLEKLLLRHVGQPFADPSLLPTALVSQATAKHVKVALSGDGADELFCGYQRYQARALLRWYSRLPLQWRRNVSAIIRLFPEPTAHHSRSLLKKAHLFLDIDAKQAAETPYIAPLAFLPAQLKSIIPDLADRGHVPPALPALCEPNLDDVSRMMIADSLIYLPQDILAKVDRASMANSLETRAPFLDHRIVELGLALPRRWHRSGLAGKKMLRHSFPDLLPDSVWRRRKQGFSVPVHSWFRSGLDKKLLGRVLDDAGPVSQQAVKMLVGEHASRRRDHGLRLWLIYAYLLNRQQA